MKKLFALISSVILSQSFTAGEYNTKMIGDMAYDAANYQLSEQSEQEVYEVLQQVYENTGSIPNNVVGAEIYVKTPEELQQQEYEKSSIDTERYSVVLPEDMTYQSNEQNSDVALYHKGKWVGEIKCYTVENGAVLAENIQKKDGNVVTNAFLDVLGFQKGSVEYISNFGRNKSDCDFEIWIREGEAIEQKKTHYFFVNQNNVCDISIVEEYLKDIDIDSIFYYFSMK